MRDKVAADKAEPKTILDANLILMLEQIIGDRGWVLLYSEPGNGSGNILSNCENWQDILNASFRSNPDVPKH